MVSSGKMSADKVREGGACATVPSMQDSSDEGPTFTCPNCGSTFAARKVEEVVCPHCGETVRLSHMLDYAGSTEHDDLDGLRIRQVFQMRRSLYRSRRYWLVAVGICIVAAGQILWKLSTSPHGSLGITTMQAIILVIAFLVGALFCCRGAARLGRLARQSTLNEPRHPPDLSSLSDGSQHWKNLEAMGRDEGRSQ